MKNATKFKADMVSDQKRVARAEHWLLARSLLRAKYNVHHSPWSVLMLAGGAPAGEIGCIRELMPKAQITAVDRDQACVDLALACGVNALRHDLENWDINLMGQRKIPVALQREHRWDVINLDLCASASPETKYLITKYGNAADVLCVTFSYGRDVVEKFIGENEYISWLMKCGIPKLLAGRIDYLINESSQHGLLSAISYTGASMPMCSLLFCRWRQLIVGWDFKFVALQEGDLESFVEQPDAAMLYALPEERVLAMRRSAIARKASITRKANQQELRLVSP